MDKFAQKRSLRSKIWESANWGGKTLEFLHSEVGETMEEMRAVDAKIREIAKEVKPLIRNIRSQNRQRNYLEAALSVSEFHQIVRKIQFALNQFTSNVNINHYNFILNNVDSSNKDKLFNYKHNEALKEACDEFYGLTKEAGPYDWFLNAKDVVTDTTKNLTGNNGRAKRLMEKRFPNSFIGKLKKETDKLVADSITMKTKLIDIFSDLETGISRRNIALYMEKAKEFDRYATNFHKSYETYDKEVLTPLRAFQTKTNEDAQAKENAKKEEERRIADLAQRAEEEKQALELEEARRHPLADHNSPMHFDEEEDEIPVSVDLTPSLKEKKEVLDRLELAPNVPDNDNYKTTLDEIRQPKKMQQAEPSIDDSEDTDEYKKTLEELKDAAASNSISDFLNLILKQSAKIDSTHPALSAELLAIANEISGDMELQREAAKEKPEELRDASESMFTRKKIDLPDGLVDQALTDIPGLNMSPGKIRFTPNGVANLKQIFITKIMDLLDIDDFKPHIAAFNKNLETVLRQSVFDGWVISASGVYDSHNPRDKYLDIYTRVNLNDLDPMLTGTAKVNLTFRLSADNGHLVLRSLSKKLEIVNPKVRISTDAPSPRGPRIEDFEGNEETELGDDSDMQNWES